MSHAIHQTKAFILNTKNMRESNKLLYLYTEKFGLIYATLQSVRDLKSKMRFHAQRFNMVEIDVVAGRDIWRITGMHEYLTSSQFVGTQYYEFLDNMSSVIMRLCQGEDPNQELWNIIDVSLQELLTWKSQQSLFEILTIARILYVLGYWPVDDVTYLEQTYTSSETFDWVEKNKNTLVQRINQGLKASQL